MTKNFTILDFGTYQSEDKRLISIDSASLVRILQRWIKAAVLKACYALSWGNPMTRFAQVIVVAAAALAVFHSTAYAVVPLGISLGTPLPFAGGGVLAVAAAAVVAGIFVKRRKR